jgi:hypothetical protein
MEAHLSWSRYYCCCYESHRTFTTTTTTPTTRKQLTKGKAADESYSKTRFFCCSLWLLPSLLVGTVIASRNTHLRAQLSLFFSFLLLLASLTPLQAWTFLKISRGYYFWSGPRSVSFHGHPVSTCSSFSSATAEPLGTKVVFAILLPLVAVVVVVSVVG